MNYEDFAGKLLIFDKDGTLVKLVNGNPPHSMIETEYLPDVVGHCLRLKQAGATLAVASNQGGVAYGKLTALNAHKLVRDCTMTIGGVYYAVCCVHPEGFSRKARRKSQFRKPAPGMLKYLADSLAFALSDCFYIGDLQTDQQAAESAGMGFYFAQEFFKAFK